MGIFFVGLMAIFTWASVPGVQKVAVSMSPDEQLLKSAGVATDGPGLLEYFRRRTPSEAEEAKLKERAVQLGSGAYSIRRKATDDLISAGRSALPSLRDVAKSSDLEATRRARYCIETIEQHTQTSLSAAAARLLVNRKPTGAVDALLAYLPFVDDETIEEDIRHSLKQLALAGGRAEISVEQALSDRAVKRRAAAVWIMGHSNDPKQRELAVQRLDDAAIEVRFLSASALHRQLALLRIVRMPHDPDRGGASLDGTVAQRLFHGDFRSAARESQLLQAVTDVFLDRLVIEKREISRRASTAAGRLTIDQEPRRRRDRLVCVCCSIVSMQLPGPTRPLRDRSIWPHRVGSERRAARADEIVRALRRMEWRRFPAAQPAPSTSPPRLASASVGGKYSSSRRSVRGDSSGFQKLLIRRHRDGNFLDRPARWPT